MIYVELYHCGYTNKLCCLVVNLYFIFTGMPLTVRYTSSAFFATYWFSHPSKSVNRLCIAFPLTPPFPISFVTKMKVASWFVNLSNSAFISSRHLSTSGMLFSQLPAKKKFVAHSVRQSISATLLYIYMLPRFRSSSMFSHCGPRLCWCFSTLSLNSSSQTWAVAI